MNSDVHEVAFKIDEKTIRKTEYGQGQILGALYLDTGEVQFPALGWDEFIVKVLFWWLEKLTVSSPKTGDDADLHFMDGPFYIRLSTPEDDKHIRLECVKRYVNREEVELVTTMELDALKRNVLDISKTVVQVCDAQKLTNVDLERLRGVLNSAEDKS